MDRLSVLHGSALNCLEVLETIASELHRRSDRQRPRCMCQKGIVDERGRDGGQSPREMLINDTNSSHAQLLESRGFSLWSWPRRRLTSLVPLERSLAGPGISEAATPSTTSDGGELVSAARVSGLDAYAASHGELNRLDKKTCRYLRALSKGRAHDSAATESHGRSWTNAQLLTSGRCSTHEQTSQSEA